MIPVIIYFYYKNSNIDLFVDLPLMIIVCLLITFLYKFLYLYGTEKLIVYIANKFDKNR